MWCGEILFFVGVFVCYVLHASNEARVLQYMMSTMPRSGEPQIFNSEAFYKTCYLQYDVVWVHTVLIELYIPQRGRHVIIHYTIIIRNYNIYIYIYCIIFIQRRPNVFAVGPILYKCYTNVLRLLDLF